MCLERQMKLVAISDLKILSSISFPYICLNFFLSESRLFVLICLYVCSFLSGLDTVYTNEFAVQVNGGVEIAQKLAEQHGFHFRGQIGSLNDYYLFEKDGIHKRSLEPSVDHHAILKNDPVVLWVEQQEVKRRVKREIFDEFSQLYPDPLYPDQWFLHGGGFGGYDMNVIPAWNDGYTGKGVVVSILDDGIQTNHPDLAQNYDKMASWDINGGDDDPTPQDNGDNKHGTRCAGEVAAVAFNGFCGVGIAYNASIGGVRMLDGAVTDATEAVALSYNPDHIHIYSASWGPEDDGKTVDGPGSLAKLAFSDGIKKGRSGLGSIFVWASGNGGRHGDSCNCDGYTNSIYTLSISSATQGGTMPWYLEQCSSTLATTYSSGTLLKDKSITTVDMDNTYFSDLENNRTPNPLTLCTKKHTGTSASAPIAAGICALALEANPKLTWRDMQYLVLMTSRPEPLANEPGWVKNGVGRLVSSKFGYGLMDAAAMVKLAKQWVTVPHQNMCKTSVDSKERIIPADNGGRLEVSMNASSCRNSENAVTFLEHVIVNITLYFKPRGNLKIVLISPAGTPSTVLLPRTYDVYEGSFNNWPFMSVHFWGESAKGLWTLVIINSGEKESNQSGKLIQWSLIFYGTYSQPVNLKQTKRDEYHSSEMVDNYYFDKVAELHKDDNDLMKECRSTKKFQLKMQNSFHCVEKCPEGTYSDLKDYVCSTCDKSCQSCYGPSYDNCLTCPKKLFLSKNFCGKSCPDGFYADALLKECLPCSDTCSNCQSTRGYCVACKNNFLLHDQSCVSACPNGTFLYKPKNMCKSCHPSCASCFGLSENQCIECRHNKYFFNKTCIPVCPDGFYNNENGQCTRCHRSCKTCSSALSCIECYQNWKPDGSGLCVSKCSKGWYNSVSKSCEQCSAPCAVCNKTEGVITEGLLMSNASCIFCDNGWYLSGNTCMKTCPEGSYVNGDECSDCGYFCKDCEQQYSKGHCLLCEDPLVLHNGICLSRCPSGYYAHNDRKCQKCDVSCHECYDKGKNQCMSCHSNSYFLNNSCHITCPVGYFADTEISECVPCYHLCRTCSGFGPWNCSSCHDHSSFSEGICIPCLDDEYFDESSKKCRRCHDRCGRCDGPSEFHCLFCRDSLMLDELSRSCLPCCSNEFPSDYKCCTCSQDLGICSVDHPRSIGHVTYDSIDLSEIVIPLNHVIPLIIAICSVAVVLFVLLFATLQARSAGWCQCNYQRTLYKRVPNNLTTRFDSEMETVSLTQDDVEEDDDVYEKA